ncbi:MAG: HEPN domain-containing protein [Candidatus Thorarchaeota archaeon]
MIVEKWFTKAETFYEVAKESLEKKRFDHACLSAQQAVEFYIKGILILKTGAKPYTHSLTELMSGLENSGVEIPSEVFDCAKQLSEHYIQARYPDARLDDYTSEEAKIAIKCMEVTFDFFRKVREASA